MRLKDILSGVSYRLISGDVNIEVSGLAYDSRMVKSGDLFFCIKGFNTDGHDFAQKAVETGAVGIIVEEIQHDLTVTQILVDNTRVAMARAASAYFDHPTSKLKLVGITGTNGKTTTSFMVDGVLRAAGYKTGLIGTIEYRIGDARIPVDLTTPESLNIQSLFADMVDNGVEAAIIEVSSHAIDLSRIEACDFDALVFTNLSQDHLDYHGTIDEYFRVKRSIFEITSDRGLIHIINADDGYGRLLIKQGKKNQLRYSTKDKVEVYATDIELRQDGSKLRLHAPAGSINLILRLPGLYNVYNALAATSVAIALGMDIDEIKIGLEGVGSVPGRFERIDCGQNFMVIVDYAHTPDSLEKVLRAARQLTKGGLITVFGCGGDRDRAKRPIMGKIGAELSDFAIITSDNPRSEEPLVIIEEIVAGAREVRSTNYCVEEDRKIAVKMAVGYAQPGDIIIIAGKGHERGQEIAGEKIPFDDREVVRSLLEEMMA
ncbi:MAG: UDP-N-acetylmuramoyl-L-alanyl-D-glutamate--2,6-diaminopimelate ligase [Actinobacteria bacterium]|nr:UDP-N-acetylmuramoyl-L-alanyl-D-glutamate--2,6-diaminopimelate ligase [Actinomycetota bacterium]